MSGISDPATDKVSAIILAGGKSSRMGTDKALLRFDNETLLERLVRIVDPLVSNIVIMLSQIQKLPPGLTLESQKIVIARDTVKEQGPLQGIADAVVHLQPTSEFVFVLSCDLPFISKQWLENFYHRIRNSSETGAVCSKQEGFLNPLIAIYRFPILQKAQNYLEQGRKSCLALLDDCIVLPMKPAVNQADLISNINTPAEYKNALLKLENTND